jgi:hypothetical protein
MAHVIVGLPLMHQVLEHGGVTEAHQTGEPQQRPDREGTLLGHQGTGRLDGLL